MPLSWCVIDRAQYGSKRRRCRFGRARGYELPGKRVELVGTALVWIVDPVRRSAQVYRPDGTVSLLGEADALQGEEVLPGFELPLAELFAE